MDGPHLGRVRSYDAARGLGVVAAVGADHPFHCTAIAGGTRQIDPGTAVAFLLAPAHGGTLEARRVTPLPDGHLAPAE